MKESGIGGICWTDMTVRCATEIRDFYRSVVGWEMTELDMGGYSDYVMAAPGSSKAVAGICHARGENAGLPAQWLIYITVRNLTASSIRCVELGGKVLCRPRQLGESGRFCVIQDPAGAVAALFEPADQGLTGEDR